MLAAELVERAQDVGGRHLLAVDRDAVAGLEIELDVLRLVRRLFRRDAEQEHVRGRLDPRVLQDAALEADVEQIAVGAVGLLRADRHGDALRLRVVDQVGAALEIPVAPRGDDLQVGRERGEGQLEADLVVALAGGAVGDGVGLFQARDVDHALGDERTRDAGAEEILVLVKRVGADHREDEVAREFLGQVVDVALGRAGLERLLVEALEFLFLADVGAERDDLRVIFFLQPRQNDGGVQTSRVSDDNLHDRLLRQKAGSNRA